jgi:hypothetical protein
VLSGDWGWVVVLSSELATGCVSLTLLGAAFVARLLDAVSF